MTQPAKVQEPSMEEILASIRRIIADDEAKPEEAVAAGAGPSVTAFESPAPRLESAPARIHTISPPPIAAVAPQSSAQKPAMTPAVAVPPMQGRGDIQPMVPSLDKSTSSSSYAFGKPASVEPAALDDADVFDLTDEMALPSATASFRTVEPKNDVEFAEPAPMTERRDPPRPLAAVSPPRASAPPSMEDILSQQTASAVESAFNSLASTVLSANSRTLEDLVKEMMRPMLKNWLDDNLPGLVERIVKTEIERVARGR